MNKRVLALILALACLVNAAPLSVFATEIEETDPVTNIVIATVSDEAASEEIAEPAADPTGETTVEIEPATESEVTEPANSCGENLTWTLDETGTLTISGTGAMTDYTSNADAPWYESRNSITEVVIEDGVAAIGDYAFAGYIALTEIRFLGDAPAAIGPNAFIGVTAAVYYPAGNTTWTDAVLLTYGGSLTWVSECPGEHDYVSVITPVTCLTEGYTTHTCSKCGDTYYDGHIAAPGHTFIDGACSVCGETINAPVIALFNNAEGYVKLTWMPVEKAVSYNIYYAASAEGPFQLECSTTGTSYISTIAAVGETWYYAVTAVSAEGVESALSNADPLSRIPARPNVTGSNITSSGKIRLTWEPVEGAVSYKVYRAASEDGNYTLKYTSNGTGYTNTGAQAGSSYYYYVVAVSANGLESDPSEIVSRTCVLPRPTVTASNNAKTGKVLLTWNPIEGATGYDIYRSTEKNSGFKKVYSVTGTSYSHTSGIPGVTYYYKVVAVHENSAANSAASAVKARMVDCAQPVITVAVNEKGKPQVNWTAVDGAVSYMIYRAESPNGPWRLKYTSTSTSYANTGAEIGKTYYYKIKAVPAHNSGASAFSNVGSAKAVQNVYKYVYATYSTTKSNGSAARNNNLAVACRAINGTIVAPGETFSFNEVVGKRTPARGYQIAPTGNGEAYGGGICQVSTTMFNVALLANMKITRRSQHKSAATYVPKGRDAMIYTTKNDFRFVNDSDYYIKIQAKASGGTVTITFLTRESGVSPRSDVSLRVTKSGNTYTLTRTFQGVVNYTATSTY